MIRKRGITVIVLIISLLASGCCSMMEPNTANMTITSTSNGANVAINGVHRGKTPLVLNIERDKALCIEFTKEGYDKTVIDVHKKLSPYFLGTLVMFGLLGLFFDICSGKITNIYEKKICGEMKKQTIHKKKLK